MNHKSAPRIALIGCGNMGAALLQGWLEKNINASFLVIDPHNRPHEKSGATEYVARIQDTDFTDISLIVLAIKPQIMKEACTALKTGITADTAILSIAAGQSIANIAALLHPGQPVIRTMPNTPAAIGKGVTIAMAGAHITPGAKNLAHTLLACAGLVEWIEDENLFDAVTALSGSGPAYLYYLIEVLEKSGIKAGLPENMAKTLARQTVIGAAALAESRPGETAETLRENVTSPGGTTEAALKHLMDGRLQNIFDEALTAARNRSAELRAG